MRYAGKVGEDHEVFFPPIFDEVIINVIILGDFLGSVCLRVDLLKIKKFVNFRF